MKIRKPIVITIGLILALALTFGVMHSVQAAGKNGTKTKALVYQQPLDLSLGKGGFYFASSNYTGNATITRTKPKDTDDLNFTQRWSEVELFDPDWDEMEAVYGVIYVYFNLNSDDWAAWNKGDLHIYKYDSSDKTWDECDTWWIGNEGHPKYGRVQCLVTEEFGRYGMAIER